MDEQSDNSDDDDSQVTKTSAAENEEMEQNNNGSTEDGANRTTLLETLHNLQFKYQERESSAGSEWIGSDQRHRSMYTGRDGLRPGVGQSFATPFECFQRCGGLTDQMVANLKAGTNQYYTIHT